MRKTTIHYLSRVEGVFRRTAIAFFRTIDMSPFLSDWLIMGFNVSICFYPQMFMQYEIYVGHTYACSCLNLSIGHKTILYMSFHTASIVSGTRTNDLHEIYLEVIYDLNWIHFADDKHCSFGEFHTQKFNYIDLHALAELIHVVKCKK